jgi:hypothetical protein
MITRPSRWCESSTIDLIVVVCVTCRCAQTRRRSVCSSVFSVQCSVFRVVFSVEERVLIRATAPFTILLFYHLTATSLCCVVRTLSGVTHHSPPIPSSLDGVDAKAAQCCAQESGDGACRVFQSCTCHHHHHHCLCHYQ